MQTLFDPDGGFSHFITRLSQLIWLNILFLVCSLPVVTFGASSAALYTVLLRLLQGEDGHLTRRFFAAWRDNWKRASGCWLLLLIVIAVCGAQRDPNYPDAPTFKEMFGDGFVFDSVYGIVAPLKTPKDRIERLQSLIKEALSDPDVQAKFAKVNMTTNYLPADEFGKVIEGYYKLFEEPIRKAKEAEKK